MIFPFEVHFFLIIGFILAFVHLCHFPRIWTKIINFKRYFIEIYESLLPKIPFEKIKATYDLFQCFFKDLVYIFPSF